MLCPSCNSLQGMGPLRTEDEVRRHPSLSTRNFKHEAIPLPNFLQSAKICYCCEILLRGVVGCLQQRQLQLSQVVQVNFNFLYSDWVGKVMDCDKIITCELDDGSNFVIEFFTLEDDDCPCPDAWEDVPTSMRTSRETNSEEAFEKACKWLKDCDDKYHGSEVPEGEDPEEWISYCAASRQTSLSFAKLPTRVVNVGRHDGKIRLVEGNGKVGKYFCLSHCWGAQQIITTTKSTLMERMREIRREDLSKTFIEAIWMTRRFRIDYIWIDSLCIIQDDPADWERESAQMASIYHNAYLTIAATKSSGGGGGLFTKTPDFEVSGTTPAGEDYYLVFREKIDHDLSVDSNILQFPLMTRAWVYQERMLSPRVLHFGYYELFFECSSELSCECGSIGFLGPTDNIPLPNPRKMYSSALDSVTMTRNGNLSNSEWVKQASYFIARMWRSLVMIYTGLRLTIASDRLPALSGVAKSFGEKRKSLYLAGLFEDSLLDDLLWVNFSGKKPRLSEWRAPSWSWASIETHINYRDGLVYYDDEVFKEKPYERIEFASIEHCACTPAGLDDFGQVRSASLRVTSQVLPVVLLLEPGLDNHHRLKYVVCIGNRPVTPRIWPDYDLSQAGPYQVLSGTEVYCLRMIRQVEDKTDISLVLRAVPTKSGTTFERIGILQLDPHSAHIDGLEPETRDLVVAALDEADIRTVNIM
ncbi:HET-domain-containing protein [Xylariaceae sp. FL0662B]|nr:HET-domain-containing protein [Xylariaceae sp. FL0662B]